LENGRIESHALSGGATKSRMAVAIVDRAFVSVGEDGIGLADFLEFLLRIRIIRITVGMVLECQLAVGALQFRLGHGASDAQHLVIVTFCVRSQKWPFVLTPQEQYRPYGLECKFAPPSFAAGQSHSAAM